ncbi:MAG: hypothetical protein N3C12_02760 [Candidatus Binatia bacterium]|nr:hypothetical protein [Candidatus Binatia bacterium]
MIHKARWFRLAAEALVFFLRENGLRKTTRMALHRCFGEEEWLGLIRYLEAPKTPLSLPKQVNGVTIRLLDRESLDTAVRLPESRVWLLPPHRRRQMMEEWVERALIAEKDGRLVGIVCYVDCPGQSQPWYSVVEPWLRQPARLTKLLYAKPGERGVAWALATCGTEWCASQGVRSILSWIQATNRSSLLVNRLQGGKIVGRMRKRFRLGRETVTCWPEGVSDTAKSALGG